MGLLNLRNALMSGKRLPYDAEVEYLQSDGQAFVNTGFVVEGGSKITCNIGMASSYGSTYGYFGASDGTGSYLGGGFNCTSPFNDRRLSVWLNNYLYWCLSANSTNVYQDGALHTMQFEMSPTIQSVAFDGTAIPYGAGFQSGVSAMPPIPTYLFAVNSAGTAKIVPASSAVKIGSFRVEKNGEIKLDIIAVRKGTVGYLYDRVTGKLFGNAGTGDFVLGPDVVPVEYIESHGKEWIDTGVDASLCNTEEMTIKCNFSVTGTGGPGGKYNGIFGAAVPRFGVYTLGQNLCWGYSVSHDNVKSFTFGNFVDSTCILSRGRQSVTFDGETFTETNSGTLSSLNIGLFCRNYSNAPQWLALARIKNFDIDASSTRRHFRPVRVGTEGAMMDTLTRRIYRNAGTGAFSYGNDLKYPIPA